MENYSKGANEEEPWDITKVPIPNLPEDITWMKVAPGSKMRNVLDFALRAMESQECILWSGSGPALTKAISCAEIMKHKCASLHQVSAICYRKVIEYWDPLIETLDQLKVTREIPTIHILLSKQPLDPKLSGYQGPSNKSVFWKTQPGSTQKPRRHNRDQKSRNHNTCDLGLIKNRKSRTRTEPKTTRPQVPQAQQL